MNRKRLWMLLAICLAFAVAWLLFRESRPRTEDPTIATDLERSFSGGSVPAPPVRPWHRWPNARRTAGPPVFPAKTPPRTLQVEWQGTWYAAEIVSSSGTSNLIRYLGYGPEWDEWVTAERMRFEPVAQTPAVVSAEAEETDSVRQPVRMDPIAGDTVVRWGEQWWRAEVLQTVGEESLIRYVGYGPESDEWVTPERVKTFSEEDVHAREQQQQFLVQGSPAKGELLIQWGAHWWPAEVLQTEGDKHLIRYKGYGAEWDEWVSAERMGVYEGD